VGLSKENRINVLKKADEFFTSKGIIFAYPVHGGYISTDTGWYDSKDPEIDIYETIKELAINKSQR